MATLKGKRGQVRVCGQRARDIRRFYVPEAERRGHMLDFVAAHLGPTRKHKSLPPPACYGIVKSIICKQNNDKHISICTAAIVSNTGLDNPHWSLK